MNKQIAIILTGCGALDGADPHETTLLLMRLDQQGIGYRFFAPDIDQHEVVNHRTGDVDEGATRRVLDEAARLARGGIQPLEALDDGEFDAVILPGGDGVVKNISDFRREGAGMRVIEALGETLAGFYATGKPVGLTGIAPALAPRLLGDGISVTVGRNPGVAGAISSMGGLHRSSEADDIVVDFEHQVVTTPALMQTDSLSVAAEGLFKLVDRMSEMIDARTPAS
ncbi:isoprenoid biosynthesis glyoxalase ElbB [Halomonas garicola]|uniref:isoprenoid biosynthesis glyoxalase ElbB n=1 Tax=Halomonas garicola TaxID=1690008 RepID=UPI00289A488A|nr:isoprenoid biosynthesis glyoxalase ElbB [Halomonas garicola]